MMILRNGYTTFTKSRDGRKGGGVAVIYRDQFRGSIPENVNGFQSFKYFQFDDLLKNKSFSLFPVYRPKPIIATMSTFFHEFSTLLEEISILAHEILILGDFNIHTDVAQNPTTRRFNDITTTFNLVQYVSDSTYENGQTLDLLLSRPGDVIINVVVDQYFSDH